MLMWKTFHMLTHFNRLTVANATMLPWKNLWEEFMVLPLPQEIKMHPTVLNAGDTQHYKFKKSKTYKMNIPVLCGKCHREGAPVSRSYNITEHNIVENYSQGIHGRGLFQAGLTVTAMYNDCHGNHLVLPHTNLQSSISQKKIASTCMKCHARIEDVHVKAINKELWEKSPGAIPACTDCHPPHKVELLNILDNISDKTCLKCHESPTIHKLVNDNQVSLSVNIDEFINSAHNNITCVKCHSYVTANIARPCETTDKVDCSGCHAEESDVYFSSGHGKAYFAKHENAPYCTDCHGSHTVIPSENENSPTFRSVVPKLCGECHKEDGKALQSTDLKQRDAYYDYSTSVHGKSLEKKGLLSAAICTDCHTTHFMLKESNERSSVHPSNLAGTCGKCHKGIYNEYKPWAKFLSELIGGAKVAGSIHRFAAVITFGYFVFHVVSLLKIKFKKGVKVSKFIFSSNSLMFNRKDIQDFWASIKRFIGIGPRPKYGR